MLAGARIIKTGLAVSLSMYICNVFSIQPAIFAGAATVLNMQPSVGQSIFNAREQLYVHFTSIGAALLLGLVIGPNPISMGLATVLVIYLCIRFKWRSAISGGVMAAVFILSSSPEQFVDHALMRSLAIFIGVGVALAVNRTIAPPRYRQPLMEKLAELNASVSQSFVEATHTYITLKLPTQKESETRKDQVERLFREANHLFDLYLFSLGPAAEDKSDPKGKESQLFRDYLTYNKGLWQRTKDILFLAQERLERRQETGHMPVSPEFQEILKLLQNALDLFIEHNTSLKGKISDQSFQKAEEPHIWSKLDQIINNWHDRFSTGSYYIHALVEVSLITYKIRWAAKESVRLLDV